MIYQKTLAKSVSITGIGLHSGKKVRLTLNPAPVDAGITFQRVDILGAEMIKAHASVVGATENNTTIGSGNNVIHTVEHLLAALYGLGINNVHVEIDGPEVPIMDGSSTSFVFILKETGVTSLSASKKFLVVLDTVEVSIGEKWARISPSSKLVIDSTIVFAHPKIGEQRTTFEFNVETFIKDISRARTFGFFKDVDMLKQKGLIKGGSLDNAIVLDDFNVMNIEGLRFRDEFVRHKILDTIGDISLLGHEVAGKITTYKSGHNLHNLLCRKLLDTPTAYQIVSAASLQSEIIEAYELRPMAYAGFN